VADVVRKRIAFPRSSPPGWILGRRSSRTQPFAALHNAVVAGIAGCHADAALIARNKVDGVAVTAYRRSVSFVAAIQCVALFLLPCCLCHRKRVRAPRALAALLLSFGRTGYDTAEAAAVVEQF
jgi:hypothetical protein